MFGIKKENDEKQFISYNKYLIDQKNKELKRIQKIKIMNIGRQDKKVEMQYIKSKSDLEKDRNAIGTIYSHSSNGRSQYQEKVDSHNEKKVTKAMTLSKNVENVEAKYNQKQILSQSEQNEQTKMKFSSIERCKERGKQNWQKIDQKATVVNGKLVYIQQEKPCLSEVSELINVLRNNNIRIKDYIYGNKNKILKHIEASYENEKNKEVQNYINNNMKKNNNVQADCSDWYAQIKDKLFNDDS